MAEHGISYLNAPGHTGETWNPVVGRECVSEGCANCYAAAVAHRGMCEQHRGLTRPGIVIPCDDGDYNRHPPARWTGEVRLVPEALAKPLSWRKPRLVLVPSMGDLFIRRDLWRYVAAVFGAMQAVKHSTFLVLTKRIDTCAWMLADRLNWWRCHCPCGGPR